MAALDSLAFTLKHEKGSTSLMAGVVMNELEGQIDLPDRFSVDVKAESTGLVRTFIEINVIAADRKVYMTDPISRKWLYSSSRLVTLELLLLGFPLVQELARSEIAQGLVRPDSVVDTLPCQEFSVQGGYVEGEISNLIKLLCVSTLSSLNAAIELR